MRNLVEYPIDETDVARVLTDVYTQETSREIAPGDLSPYILYKLQEFFKNNPQAMADFLETMKIKVA